MKRIKLCLIMLMISSPIFIQAGMTGKIVGKITDSTTGEPLIGANVILEATSLGAAADVDGYFMVLNIMPGTYNLRAMMIGYKDLVQRDVRVSTDLTTTIDFSMEVATLVGQEVVVYAKEKLVKMDVTSTSFKVSSDQINQLQVESLSDIVELQAGVVDGHFRGGRSGEVMYIIDGIPMNDSYSGDHLFDIDSDMIQEVEVISGTFNAEYGQAMSGIVNIVTKEGQEYYSGKVSFYNGDYFSSHNNTFMYINHVNPVDISNIQMSLSGPVPLTRDNLCFSLTGRRYASEGWQYGRRIFQPGDFSYFSDNPDEMFIQSTGDSAYVPLNPSTKNSIQGKLSFKLGQRDKINYTAYYEDESHRDFDRLFKYNPDGNYHHFSNSYQQALQYTHMFGQTTFLTANISESFTKYEQFVYRDPYDLRYVPLEYMTQNNSNGFATGGMRMWHHLRDNRTRIYKTDLRSQITKFHTVGLGASYKISRLWLHEYQLYFDENWEIKIPSLASWYNNTYIHEPVEIAAYMQDKVEFGEMIINLGLRYDYFDPDGVVPENFYNTVDAPKLPAATSSQLSPRIGIAYPISDRGVIHFSYGHFFQVPNYEHLYINPDFEVSLVQLRGDQPPRGSFNIMGNAELKPEKTVSYEVGLKQEIIRNLTLDITGYNKDIRDLIGQITLSDIYGGKFWRFVNRDYANVKGITVALELHETPGGVGMSLDYTYQSATGNASDPLDESKNQESEPPIQSEKKRQPLDWDQTHSLNLSVTTTQAGFSYSLIGKIGSGSPYTRESPYYNNRILNGERKPMTMTFDLSITRDFQLHTYTLSPFLKISNLFDRKNNRDVYASSGTADFDYNMVFETYRGYRTQEEWYIQPNFYDEPRKIILGCAISFNKSN
ncbi:MAG: TonB-dependent receptor [Candidatus Neomarinimicrobiota bacterium]